MNEDVMTMDRDILTEAVVAEEERDIVRFLEENGMISMN